MDEKEEFKRLFIEYQIKKDLYPKELRGPLELFFGSGDFYFNVAQELIDQCSDKLTELACRQYPDLNTVRSKIIKDYFVDINQGVLLGIAYGMKKLVQDMNNGIDLKEKYPKMDSWRSFYLHPQPETMDDFERNMMIFPSDEEWNEYIETENREMKRFFIWEEKRKTEFYNVVQPVLMKLYPKLLELQGDFWLLYAVTIRDEYEIWKSSMEDVELGVIYEMPDDFVNWEHKVFSEEISKRFAQYDEISSRKRDEQINSIKLDDE